MPDWNAPLDDWIKFYSPESYSVVGVEREVPVHRFLVELKAAREALEMVRDADDDCLKDDLPHMPPAARSKIDRAIDLAANPKPRLRRR